MSDVVFLRNGQHEPKMSVVILMSRIYDLYDTDPEAIFELNAKCKNDYHAFYGNHRETLIKAGLLTSAGQVSPTVRNIVESAVIDTGSFEVKIQNPAAS